MDKTYKSNEYNNKIKNALQESLFDLVPNFPSDCIGIIFEYSRLVYCKMFQVFGMSFKIKN